MSIQGARNRASGAFFEDAILRVCRHYWLSGQAIKDLGGGRFVAHYAKKAQPDFQGNLQGGRSVCFEAKHTETNEQAAVLDVKEALGALCFVLVSFGFREFYRVPWAVWRDMRAHFGHKYMTPEEGAAYRLPVTMGLLLFLDPKDYDHER